VLTQGEKILSLKLCARQDAFKNAFQKKRPRLAVLVGAVGAIVFLEHFLGKTVDFVLVSAWAARVDNWRVERRK